MGATGHKPFYKFVLENCSSFRTQCWMLKQQRADLQGACKSDNEWHTEDTRQ